MSGRAGAAMRTHMQALLMGEAAARHLDAARFKVIASFSRSLYLENPAGKLVCLCREDLEPSPLALLCAPWFSPDALPQPGERLFRAADRLESATLELSLTGCPSWTPAPFPLPDGQQLRASLALLRKRMEEGAPEQGFAPLLPYICGMGVNAGAAAAHGGAGAEPRLFPDAPLLQEGWKGLAALCRWLRAVEKETTPKESTEHSDDLDTAVHALLGLGPGLTPSGDDALGGAMIALHALGRNDLASRMAEAVSLKAAQATNSISRAHLEVAASGQGGGPLHNALAALMRAGPDLGAALQGLDRMGHSSGWDAFAGAVAVLALSGPPPSKS